MPLVAVYDANILYPAPLRDFFIRLAQAGLVQAKWTNTIHGEWIHALLRNEPALSRSRLERSRDLMNVAVPDCLIEDYEFLVEKLDLPDSNDRHVLAAAICAQAALIVTENLRDFPEKVLKQYGVEAVGPDMFALQALALDRGAVLRVLREQRSELKEPPAPVEDFLNIMRRQGLPRTVNMLRLLAETS